MVAGGGKFRGPGASVSLHRSLVAVPTSHEVHVYDLSTRKLAMVLRGHLDTVSAAQFSGVDDSQLITASADGTLGVWDVESGELRQSVLVGQPISGLAVPRGANTVHLAVQWGERDAGRVRFLDLATVKLLQPSIRLTAPSALTASRCGGFVATPDSHRILVWHGHGSTTAPLVLQHTKPFVCVAISEMGERLAAGDATGRILLWRSLAAAVSATAGSSDPQPKVLPQTTVHWHANAVRALSFSLDSHTLLSGGLEGVMVSWRLANMSRSYCAHLGAPITAVLPCSTDDAAYIIVRADNSLCSVSSSTGSVTEVAAGVIPEPAPGDQPVPPPIACAGSIGSLALVGEGAKMQLLDSTNGRASTCHQVGSLMPALQAPRQLPRATLQHLTFSGNGLTMVTVDCRFDGGSRSSAASCLKFWTTEPALSPPSYRLATAVEAPHGPADVASVAHHPSAALAATAGSDGIVRLWQPAVDSNKLDRSDGGAWHCSFSWAHQGEPIGRLVFSSDGSLLAGATREAVVLWDVSTASLAASLPLPVVGAAGATPLHLAFAADGMFLAAAAAEATGSTRVTVWDLLTLCVAWTAVLPVTALAGTHDGGLVAAVGGGSQSASTRSVWWDGAILDMAAASAQLSCCWRARALLNHVLADVSQGHRSQGSRSLLVMGSHRTYEVAHEGPEPAHVAAVKAMPSRAADYNLLQAVYGTNAVQTAPPKFGKDRSVPSTDATINRLDRPTDLPSHLLQPVQHLAHSFLQSLM